MRQFYITLDQEEYPEKQKGDKEKWKEHFIQENIGIFLKNRDTTARRSPAALRKSSKQYFMGQMTKGSIMNQDLIWDTWRTQEIMMCVRKECLMA